MEVNNPEVATNITADANDVVMVNANTAPEANEAPEANKAPEVNAATPEVNAAAPEVQVPEAHVVPEAHEDNANAPVPPPRTLIPDRAFPQIGSGAISSAATIHVSYTIKGAYFHICASTLKL